MRRIRSYCLTDMGALLTTDPPVPSSTGTTEERVHRAVLTCVGRFGLTKTTIDDVARESGVSRATIYRSFPGGRDALVQAVLLAEVDRFFAELCAAVEPLDDLEELLVVGIGTSMRFLWTHEALKTIVEVEPGLLLPQFAFHRLDVVLAHAADAARPFLESHVGSPLDAITAAEHLVRVVLTYTIHPDRRVDPFDESSLRRLVRTFVLPGLIR